MSAAKKREVGKLNILADATAMQRREAAHQSVELRSHDLQLCFVLSLWKAQLQKVLFVSHRCSSVQPAMLLGHDVTCCLKSMSVYPQEHWTSRIYFSFKVLNCHCCDHATRPGRVLETAIEVIFLHYMCPRVTPAETEE